MTFRAQVFPHCTTEGVTIMELCATIPFTGDGEHLGLGASTDPTPEPALELAPDLGPAGDDEASGSDEAPDLEAVEEGVLCGVRQHARRVRVGSGECAGSEQSRADRLLGPAEECGWHCRSGT